VNEIGSLVWGLIDGRKTDVQIADAVRAAVQDPPDSLDADVAAFLGTLRARHLAFESG
jgi:hypothetical protein